MTRPAKLDAHDLRRVAVEAGCDPRTVTRHLGGEFVRGPVKARIADALRKLGLVPPPDREPAPREEGAR